MRATLLVALLLGTVASPNLTGGSPVGQGSPTRLKVRVSKLDGMSESGDCVVFWVGKARYYVYAFGDAGDRHAHLVINSFHKKRPICIELNPTTKGLVDKVYEKCEQ